MASSFLEKKAKKQAEELEKKYGSSAYGGTTWLNNQLTGKKASNNDIAPVAKKKKDEEEERTWFDTSVFDDGFQVSDIPKIILGTGEDLAKSLGAGLVGIGETVVDAFATVAPYVSQAQWNMNGGDTTRFLAPEVAKQHDELIEQSKKDISRFVSKDLYDEQKVAETIIDNTLLGRTNKALGVDSKTHSVLGEKSDALAQSGGQLLGQLGANAILPGSGMALMGITSFGSEAENALMNDATLDEALFSGAFAAGAEMLTEKLGGISFGGKTLTDAAFSNLSRNMTSKLAKVLITTGKVSADALAEGGEEILSGYMSAIGQKLTYMSDKEIEELFSSEDLLESFIGGAVLGGLGGAGDAVKSAVKGVDPVSGLDKNEQAVVEKEYNTRLEEREANGKLTNREKNKLYDSVVRDMEKGIISTDTIEEVLGGESYNTFKSEMDGFFEGETFKSYKEALVSEDAEIKKLESQLKELESEPNTVGNSKKYDAIQSQIDELKNNGKSKGLKSILDQEAVRINGIKNQLRDEVSGLVKDSRLAESYRELARKNEKFTVDLNQYENENAKKTMQNLMDSGLGDNTRQFHEFADFLARLSADKGTTFTMTNDEQLAKTEYWQEGAKVNAFINENGDIVLNKSSDRALNTSVGHEITHVLESSKELYGELSEVIKNYAISKEGLDSYNKRIQTAERLYKGKKNTTAEKEVVADLVGEYLFTDSDFIHRLSTENRNVFQKIYDEVKYLCKIVTAGSKEARELEKVKKAFEDAYRADNKAQGGTKHSLGYHAGDLGKSEDFYHMVGRGRGTGHFGTGTYFVGDEAKISDSYYGKRPHEKVDFDKYNLYKVRDNDRGYNLHRFLQGLNDNIMRLPEAKKSFDEYYDSERKVMNAAEDTQFGEWTDDAEVEANRKIIDEYIESSFSDYEKQMLNDAAEKRYNDAQTATVTEYDRQGFEQNYKRSVKYFGVSETLEEYVADSVRIREEAIAENKKLTVEDWYYLESYDLLKEHMERNEDYRDWYRGLSLGAMKSGFYFGEDKLHGILDDIYNTVKDYGYDGGKYLDSASTMFMKALGYEGIDVRGTGLDNTSYGSVIYDLKGEDLARKKEIGTAKYSLSMVEKIQPKSDKWSRTHTTEEAMAKFPNMWNVAAEESEVRNPTQITSTVNSYRKIYNFLQNEGFDGTILDASSGLGYGTRAGIEEYGFNVEDIEPYPDKGYTPKYQDYSALDKKYDVIISNAVLNVLPQDQRDALAVKMGELLNDGGRLFVNVRGKDVESLAKTGKNIHLGNMEWIETVKGSYQKGFTKPELVAYLQDALGDGFTVKPTNMFGAVSAVVTKDGTKYSLSDSDGKQLTNEQAEFFKDSKVRDKNGNLLKVYHGTPRGGFTEFNDALIGATSDYGYLGRGFYFTVKESVAKYYAGYLNSSEVKAGYLNIKNPYTIPSKRDIAFTLESIMGHRFDGEDADYERSVAFTKWLKDNGYDGVICRDEIMALHSNQFKNVDNTKPTDNPDIRYSLSDSDGKQLTKEQQEFFKDSKMRDENGNLKVMYHGSQDAGFHVFDPGMSDDNTSFFFVDRNDVAASYSGTSETYEAKTIRSAEDMNNFLAEIGYDHYEAIEKDGKFELLEDGDHVAWSDTAQGIYDEFCWYEGVGNGDANYKVYLNLKNPLEVDAEGRNWDNVSSEFSQDVYDAYQSLTESEKEHLTQLASWEDVSVFRDEILDAVEGDATEEYALAYVSAYNKLGGKDADLSNLFSAASEGFTEEAIKENAVKRLKTRDYAQKAKAEGYDGVIFKNIVDVGGYGGDYTPSTVAIAFDSNQIKSVANTKPTGNPDIRYSLTEYTEEEKKAHNKAVLEHFGKTYKWAETGYVLLDGSRLDLSGKHEGAPGGYRTVDHRDIVDALGSDYGDDTYSGSLVQFMSEGNIRISPESMGINLSVKPTKAQEQSLSDFISRARGEVLLDIDDFNGYTVVSVEYPRGTHANKVLNDIRAWFDSGKEPEVSNLSQFRYSLSKKGEKTRRYGDYNIYGKDIGVNDPLAEFAPVAENATTEESSAVADKTKATVSEKESVAPVVISKNETTTPVTPEEMRELFPDDLAPNELDALVQEKENLENRMLEMGNTEDFTDFETVNERYTQVLDRIAELESAEAERVGSLTDADIPPEREAVRGYKAVTAEDPFADRSETAVGNRSVKAYQYENPEVKPFFREAAYALAEDINLSIPAERWYNDDLYYASGGEQGFGGNSRLTAKDVGDFKDQWKCSWDDLKEAVSDIIEDHGKENNALSKRVEFLINDRLMYGYTNIRGERIEPNQAYLDFLKEKQINEYSQEAREAFFANADQYAPFDIAPVSAAPAKAPASVSPYDAMGAAPYGFDPITELQYKYGNLPDGEHPVREDSMPKSITGKDKVSLTARTVKGAGATPDEFVDLLHKETLGGRFSYIPITNSDTVQKAYDEIVKKGWEAARGEWEAKVRRGEVSAELTATGSLLLNHAAKAGDRNAWLSVLHDYQIMGTNAGQAIQAMRILKTLTPDDSLYMIERSVEQMVEDMKLGTEIVIDENLKQNYLNAKTDGERDTARQAIAKDVARQIPSTAMDKWTALRYLNMLGNLRTQGRNIIGNLGMSVTTGARNAVATGIEWLANKASGGKFHRTKSIFVNKDQLKAAKNDFANVKDVALNGGKFNDPMAKTLQFQQEVQDARRIFKFAPLEGYRRATNWSMDTGDLVFSKVAYGRALAGYLKANGIKETDFSKIDQQKLDEARAYAINEAQETTFRDNNWLSSWVSKLGRGKNTPKGVKIVSEGVMPFRKTPANILLRAEEYSPLGIVNATVKSIQAAKGTKNVTGAEVVNSWAKALTGTGLFALGMWLNNSGMLSGGPDEDDDKDWFEDLYGWQNYAIQIGDNNYTIDFLSPAAMPLLMGAQLNELRQTGGIELKDLEKALLSIADPMIEMSMLQGVNDTLDNIRYAESNMGQFLVNACVSYLTQGLTNSFLGQLERSVEGQRMSTYTDKDSDLPAWLQKALGKASAKTPGWDYQQIPYVDAWGETEDIAPLPGLAENALSPSYISQGITDAVYEELNRLNDAQSDINVYPQTPDKTVTFDDAYGNRHKDYNLSAEEYVELAQLQGQTQKELVEDILSNYQYSGLNDQEKARAVQLAYQYAKEYSRQEVLGADGFSADWMKRADAKGDIVNAIIAHTNDEKTFAYENPEKYQFFTENGISWDDYDSADEDGKREYSNMFTWVDENPGKYTMSKVISDDFLTFWQYKNDCNNFDAKDENGETVSGLKKERVINYINSLDIDYGARLILFRSMYDSKKDKENYNRDIVEYLNSREDISYEDMVTILKELDFTVSPDGRITWD